MQKAKRVQESGGAKLKRAGKKAIMLGVTPEQKEKLVTAAAREMRPVTQFIVFYVMQAVDKILRQDATMAG